jgi:hypothetical protein
MRFIKAIVVIVAATMAAAAPARESHYAKLHPRTMLI